MMIIGALLIASVLTLANIGSRNLIILLLAIDMVFFALTLACAAYFFGFLDVM